ncbi:MAG: glycosyltransferase [Trueperaceae bacterium]
MNIAMISEHASPLAALGGVDSGGQNVYVAQVASELGRRGHRVTVFTRRDDPELPGEMRCAPNVSLVHIAAGPARPVPKEEMLPLMPRFTEGVLAYLGQMQRPLDLVHAHFFMSAQVAAELQRVRGLPFVVTFHALGRIRRRHQGVADRFPVERFAIEERAVAEARLVIAECPQDRDDLIELYGAGPEQIRVAPCGYSPEELGPTSKPEARRRLGLAESEPVILQLGRMVPRKGVATAIEGLARLRRRHGVLAQLLVVGGNSATADPRATPEIGRLLAVAEKEGVANSVRFEGRRDRAQLRDYYGAADIFISTPWYEPFGITPVEAMACGLPVLGSAVGGIKSTVVDGETGFLVPADDPDAVAERLAAMLGDRRMLRRMGERALERAAGFTWSRVTDRLESIYAEAVAATPSKPRETSKRRRTETPTAALGRSLLHSGLHGASLIFRAGSKASHDSREPNDAEGGR